MVNRSDRSDSEGSSENAPRHGPSSAPPIAELGGPSSLAPASHRPASFITTLTRLEAPQVLIRRHHLRFARFQIEAWKSAALQNSRAQEGP